MKLFSSCSTDFSFNTVIISRNTHPSDQISDELFIWLSTWNPECATSGEAHFQVLGGTLVVVLRLVWAQLYEQSKSVNRTLFRNTSMFSVLMSRWRSCWRCKNQSALERQPKNSGRIDRLLRDWTESVRYCARLESATGDMMKAKL